MKNNNNNFASKRCFVIVSRIPDNGNLIKTFLHNLSDVYLMLLPFVSGHIIKQIWTDPSSKSGYMDLRRTILHAALGLGHYCSPSVHIT